MKKENRLRITSKSLKGVRRKGAVTFRPASNKKYKGLPHQGKIFCRTLKKLGDSLSSKRPDESMQTEKPKVSVRSVKEVRNSKWR